MAGTLGLWKSGELRLDRVLEVGKESESILELDLERLVVDGGPCAGQVLLCAVDSVFAEDGLDLEFVHELYFPYVLLSERELVVLGQDLQPENKLVC